MNFLPCAISNSKLISLAHSIIHNIPALILGAFGIGIVMAIHEYGHFIFGKLFNAYMPNFSLGFGPKLFKYTYGETTYSLSIIPIGAYVEFSNDETASGGHERTLEKKSYWQKMLILSGGILCNLLFAYSIFVGLSLTGIPATPLLNQNNTYFVNKVLENSCAQKAQIQAHDRIIAFNNIPVDTSLKALFETIAQLANQTVPVLIQRDGQLIELTITVDSKIENQKKRGWLGVEFACDPIAPVSFTQALIQAGFIEITLIKNTFTGIKHAFIKKSASQFSGPLMMISLISHSAKQGLKLFLLLLAVISVGLAVLNMLPLPVL